jgi:hypothetical protein
LTSAKNGGITYHEQREKRLREMNNLLKL